MTSVSTSQLLAKDEEDQHFILNPSSTFFKSSFQQHTNFATEIKRLNFNDVIKWGNRVSTCIPVLGDLLSKLTLEIKLPKLPDELEWVHDLGFAMIEDIDLNIGGTTISSTTGEYMYMLHQLEDVSSKKSGLDYITGHRITSPQSKDNVMYIPISLWFTKGYSNSLPLLTYSRHQETFLHVHLKPIEKLTVLRGSFDSFHKIPPPDVTILAQYTILDKWEKAEKTSKEEDILIEQLFFSSHMSRQRTFKIPINVKGPVKEIIFALQNTYDQDPNNSGTLFKYTYENFKNPIKNISLHVNGAKTLALPGTFFNIVQPYYHRTAVPDNAGIMIYPFSLYPEMYQPSGSINFNALGDAEFVVELEPDYFDDFPTGSPVEFRMYIKSMNILKVIPDEGAMLMYM